MVFIPPTQLERLAESAAKCIKAVLMTHLTKTLYVGFSCLYFLILGVNHVELMMG